MELSAIKGSDGKLCTTDTRYVQRQPNPDQMCGWIG